jgi:SAM-dependent methyltransferase
MDAKILSELLSEPTQDLDLMVHRIRGELERKQREACTRPIDRDSGAPLQRRSRKRKKALIEYLDIRVLFQNLIGARNAIKLAKRLDPLQYGALPLQEMPQIVGDLYARVGAVVVNVESQDRHIASLESRYELLEEGAAAGGGGAKDLASRVAQLEALTARLHAHLGVDQSGAMAHQETSASSGFSKAQQLGALSLVGSANQTSSLTALYTELKENLLGKREDVLARRRIYISEIKTAVGVTKQSAVLDIGSGHGEFLEMLRANGLAGVGVELDASLVATCKERGLDATEADAFDYLARLLPATLASVSALHIAEHLPFERLHAFLEAVYRALAPGGLLLIETPNPDNLVVAAGQFYLDPTRRHPLPSETMSFLVKTCGFVDPKIVALPSVSHPHRAYEDPMLAFLQEKIYCTQDYGLLAWKPC